MRRERQQGNITYLEGNIGPGKSTIIEWLNNKYDDVATYCEPVKTWMECGVFQACCEDPDKYMYAFQTVALTTKLVRKYSTDKYNLSERSGIADRYVFMETNKHHLTRIELDSYDLYYNDLLRICGGFKPSAKFIILECSPEICMKRIIDRSRDGETSITIDYLQKLDMAQKNNLIPYLQEHNYRIKIINVEADLINDIKTRDEILDKIHEFMKQ